MMKVKEYIDNKKYIRDTKTGGQWRVPGLKIERKAKKEKEKREEGDAEDARKGKEEILTGHSGPAGN